MPFDDDRLQALRLVPMLMKSAQFAAERAEKADPAQYAVVSLATDLFSSVVEQSRRYPGWVIVFSVTPAPGGNGQANVDIREFFPRQAEPGDVDLTPNMTIGEAMAMFDYADARGIDLLERDPRFTGSFAKQRPVPVG